MQKLYFIYINSINNIYRLRRFSLRANEGLKQSLKVLVAFFPHTATQQNIMNGFTGKAIVVW